MPAASKPRLELLPSPPPRPLRMDAETVEDVVQDAADQELVANDTRSILSIRGAAATGQSSTNRLSLVERLAKAKAEARVPSETTLSSSDAAPPLLVHSQSDPTQTTLSKPGMRAAVQARLKLRLKLASEKKVLVFNLNESRAQELRAKILEAKARREAEETDAVLREMDKVDRAKEVRRRLMVLKMMAAETDSEKRARELKEKLVNDKKARVLREKLLSRKKSQTREVASVGTVVTA